MILWRRRRLFSHVPSFFREYPCCQRCNIWVIIRDLLIETLFALIRAGMPPGCSTWLIPASRLWSRFFFFLSTKSLLILGPTATCSPLAPFWIVNPPNQPCPPTHPSLHNIHALLLLPDMSLNLFENEHSQHVRASKLRAWGKSMKKKWVTPKNKFKKTTTFFSFRFYTDCSEFLWKQWLKTHSWSEKSILLHDLLSQKRRCVWTFKFI